MSDCAYFSDKGFYLNLGKRNGRFAHSIGGRNELPGAVCNGHKCDQPFVRLLTLDLRDPRLSFIPASEHGPLLPLLYCWPCGGEPTYRLDPSGQVTVIGRSSTGREKDFPYPDYPEFFPERAASLVPVPGDIQKFIVDANAGTIDADVKFRRKVEPHMRPHHQIGGAPYLVQGDREPGPCPQCGAPMPVLASASSKSGGKRDFVDDPFTQVVFEYCAACRIVSASHESD